MGRVLNGREALSELDRLVSRQREALCDALASADEVSTRRAELRHEQARAYASLVDLHWGLARSGSISASLGRIVASAAATADRQAAFIREEAAALEAVAAELRRQEAGRRTLSEAQDKAVEAYEGRVAAVEAALNQNPDYAKLQAFAQEARAVNRRALRKLEIARSDRDEKGKPYQQDPLFSYLWERGFRMAHYRASPLVRLLDGWVARLCGYEKAYPTYQLLIALPDRIAEHADAMARQADEADTRLAEAQARALADPELETLKQEITRVRAQIEACDAAIEAAETHHTAMVERHEAALRQEAGPAREIRQSLEDALRKASFPDLRVLAAETVEPDDDRIVDKLVQLRKEDIALDLEDERNAGRPAALRDELGLAEALRRQFKQARFDSPLVTFPRSGFDEVLTDLMRGRLDVRSALQLFARQARRVETSPDRDPEFGGRGRRQTIGFPEMLGGVIGSVLGEVLEEVIRETPGNWRPPKGARSPGPSGRRAAPSGSRGRSRKSGGGFRTGGGF